MIDDSHVKLLTKAFGDLDARPFAWCFDADADPQPTEQPAAAPQEPRALPVDGETYISSWSEIVYEMTNGQMGNPPQSLRRYKPQQK